METASISYPQANEPIQECDDKHRVSTAENNRISRNILKESDQASTTLFATSVWFEAWLAAFGGPKSGIWYPKENPDSVRIPYLINTRHFGPISLQIAVGASNSFTPRFDSYGSGVPTAAHLQRMANELNISALVFPYLASEAKIAQVVVNKENRLFWFRDFCENAPFVNCSGNWGEYLQSRKKSHRDRWLYSERRILKGGGYFEKHESWGNISARFDEVLDVEASGWKGQSGTAIKQSDDTLHFFRSVCRDMAEMNKLRLFLLCRDEKIIAFRLCTLHQGVLSSLKIGYREEFSKEAPGNVLKLWTAKWAFENPEVRIFDTLGPASADKLMWSTGVATLHTLYVMPRNIGGLIVWLRYDLLPKTKMKMHAHLSKLNNIRRTWVSYL